MNIHNNLDESLEYISLFNGQTINLEERLKLEIGLNDLKMNIKSEDIFFWGKIVGIEKDYYIAMAVFYKNQLCFPKKVFYFCSSNSFIFSLLPEVQDYHIKLAAQINTYFMGNPETIIEYMNTDVENFNPNNFDDIYRQSQVKKNFTEADRLAYVVRNIEFECSIVPEGAYKMLPIGEIRVNDNFRGLNEDKLEAFRSYLHFRPPITEDKNDLIKRGEGILNFNFLDDLSQEKKKGNLLYFLF
jgi:radial spoke head protein 9